MKFKKNMGRTRDLIQRSVSLLATDPLASVHHVSRLASWALNSENYDLNWVPSDVDSDLFLSARDAVSYINNGDMVATSGFGGMGRNSLFFWAVKDAWLTGKLTGNLTWFSVSGQGGRGMADGTVEELAQPGLITRYICGHLESASALLALAAKGDLILHTLPQGILTQLIKAQALGKSQVRSPVGVGTFLDPRCGRGSAITSDAKENFISATPKAKQLTYRLPQIDVALIAASYADTEGNIYFYDMPSISECKELAEAVYATKGTVLVSVKGIVPLAKEDIAIPAEWVSGIAVHPHQEQVAGLLYGDASDALMPNSSANTQAVRDRAMWLNAVSWAAPYRSDADVAVTRVAAALCAHACREGALANVGVGMSEGVPQILFEAQGNAMPRFTTEVGVEGGLPLPGIFFGAAATPDKIQSSYTMFSRYAKELDVTVLGMLEMDLQGNINVSSRGKDVSRYVGPGGFCDITEGADTLIFLGSYMRGADVRFDEGELHINMAGMPKLVEQVMEVTFNGQHAYEQGKSVYYVNHAGVFKLTASGLMLTHLMPGIRLEEDVLAYQPMLTVSDQLGVVSKAVLRGETLNVEGL